MSWEGCSKGRKRGEGRYGPGDTHDTRGPHVQLRLLDGGDFEKVEGGGVEEKK